MVRRFRFLTVYANGWKEMKLIAAAIYSNYTTHTVDDTGIEQTDG